MGLVKRNSNGSSRFGRRGLVLIEAVPLIPVPANRWSSQDDDEGRSVRI
jgi:hypothetical protein